jgi:2-polyprenyl-3-methyl-5-hydroxy-6-metoxy-1,4-benzoquinol methylase
MRQYVTTYQEHLARYVWALRYCVDATVCDMPCGTGYGTNLLADVARTVYGYDISREAVQYARERYSKPTFVVADLSDPRAILPDGWAAVVTSFEGLEHMSDPEVFVRNVKRVLLKDGTFLFSVPRNAPSQYHLTVWDWDEVAKLMRSHFREVTWAGQSGIDVDHRQQNATFILGIARGQR